MLVVFFHVGGWLRQGHIGVDIFFVISGFVISTAYFDRFVERPSLSTALSFLGRRVLRLMPALLVTVLATFLFTDLVFPPTENKSIALQAGIAAIFNYSNIFFIKSGTNYWLDTLVRNPFLHTWSLGVEWQFYLVFPILMVVYGLLRCRTKKPLSTALLAGLGIVAAASLVAFATAPADDRWGFYAPWPRCWQFSIGIIAFLATRRHPRNSDGPVQHALSLLSLGLILLLAALPRDIVDAKVTSVAASFVTAVLLVLAPTSRSIAGRILDSRAAQTLGAASYSIYLVHWPLAVFGRLVVGDDLVFQCVTLGLILPVGLALSRSVEYKFLHTKYPGRALAVCLTLILTGYGLYRKRERIIDSIPGYGNSVVAAHIDGFHNFWWTEIPQFKNLYRHNAQFNSEGLSRQYWPDLHMYEANAEIGSTGRMIVGVGNSYLQSAGDLLRTYARQRGSDLKLYEIYDCDGEHMVRCDNAFAHAIADLQQYKNKIEVIFIAFRGLDRAKTHVRNVLDLVSRFDQAGVQVVVQGPSPDFTEYDPHECMKIIHACPNTMTMSPSDTQLSEQAKQLAETFAGYQRASIWSPYLTLCKEKDGGLVCRARIDGASLFIDSDHFSIAGERYLYPFFLNHIVQAHKESSGSNRKLAHKCEQCGE
jgi:peptidoglycan/LPS O-acetylase OafA/YrhL